MLTHKGFNEIKVILVQTKEFQAGNTHYTAKRQLLPALGNLWLQQVQIQR